MKQVSLPLHDIEQLIPQRHPILMVDTLMDYSETEVQSAFRIEPSNIFVDDSGMLSEPGLVENMAQTVALHTGYAYYLKEEPAPTGYIGAIKSIHISSLPKVGETLSTKATILHEIFGVTVVDVMVYNKSGDLLAQGNMKTVIPS